MSCKLRSIFACGFWCVCVLVCVDGIPTGTVLQKVLAEISTDLPLTFETPKVAYKMVAEDEFVEKQENAEIPKTVWNLDNNEKFSITVNSVEDKFVSVGQEVMLEEDFLKSGYERVSRDLEDIRPRLSKWNQDLSNKSPKRIDPSQPMKQKEFEKFENQFLFKGGENKTPNIKYEIVGES